MTSLYVLPLLINLISNILQIVTILRLVLLNWKSIFLFTIPQPFFIKNLKLERAFLIRNIRTPYIILCSKDHSVKKRPLSFLEPWIRRNIFLTFFLFRLQEYCVNILKKNVFVWGDFRGAAEILCSPLNRCLFYRYRNNLNPDL